MSADNFLGILKCKDGKWRGFGLSASMKYAKKKKDGVDMTFKQIEKAQKPLFTAKTKKKAILKGMKEIEKNYYEYGLGIIKYHQKVDFK